MQLALPASPVSSAWQAVRRRLAARAVWDASQHIIFLQRNYASLDPRLKDRLARARQELEAAWVELTNQPS